MAQKIAIDIGSNYITIFNHGTGVVLKEPSIVITARYRRKTELVATGSKAVKMLGRLEKAWNVIYPINEGAVTNIEACTLMLEDYIRKVNSSMIFRQKADVLGIISCGLTIAERRDIELVLSRAGAAEITLVEAPVPIFQQGSKDNALVMIIGGDLTETAIVSDEGIISGCSIDIAGEAFNRAIADYIAMKYKVQIGGYTAEKIKISIGSMYENDMSTIEINGKDLVENAPRSLEITASDVRRAVTPLLEKFVEVIDSLMCSCPDNIIDEVYNNGLFLAGGTAQMPGIGEYIGQRCRMTVTVLTDPINAVANGGGSLLADQNSLNRMISGNSI